MCMCLITYLHCICVLARVGYFCVFEFLYFCIFVSLNFVFCICVLSKVGLGLRWRNRRIEKWLPASSLHLQLATAKLHNKLRKHIRLHNHIFGQFDLHWWLQCGSKHIYGGIAHFCSEDTVLQEKTVSEWKVPSFPTSSAVKQTTNKAIFVPQLKMEFMFQLILWPLVVNYFRTIFFFKCRLWPWIKVSVLMDGFSFSDSLPAHKLILQNEPKRSNANNRKKLKKNLERWKFKVRICNSSI